MKDTAAALELSVYGCKLLIPSRLNRQRKQLSF